MAEHILSIAVQLPAHLFLAYKTKDDRFIQSLYASHLRAYHPTFISVLVVQI